MRMTDVFMLLILMSFISCHAEKTATLEPKASWIDDPALRLEYGTHKLRAGDTERNDPAIKTLLEQGQSRDALKYDEQTGRVNGMQNYGRDVIKSLFYMGADETDMMRVIKAAQVPGSDKHGPWGAPKKGAFVPARAVLARYKALPQDKKNALTDLKPKDLPGLLHERARDAYYNSNPWYSRLFTLPSWRVVLAGTALAGATALGRVFLNKINHQLNWVSLERHVLRQRMLEEFGHAEHVDLQNMLNTRSSKLDPEKQQMVERFLIVDKRYAKLNMQWALAMLAFAGGGIGSVINLGMHINQQPVDGWQAEIKKGIEAAH